jgi:hypothetical protein
MFVYPRGRTFLFLHSYTFVTLLSFGLPKQEHRKTIEICL